jgi:uncharacterized membrane protein YsdA (DUF1294 family)/cold shock CspA family protein
MRKTGTVVRWDGARGFGFIRCPSTPADVFFHVRDFRGVQPPSDGLMVAFEEIHVGGKGPRAMAVQAISASAGTASGRAAPAVSTPRSASARRAPPRRSADARSHARGAAPTPAALVLALALISVWAAGIAWGVWTGRLPRLVLFAAPLLNLATFYAYWIDKFAAQTRRWRTREDTLHLLSLLGGWPGAWAAHQVLRHKSRKTRFRITYWVTVVLNGLGLALWLVWSPALTGA